MKYIRNFIIFILSLVIIYTVAGFFVLPWFLTNKASSIVKEKVGVNVELGQSKFNPYTFELSIKDILLKDLDKKAVFRVKAISLDYTLSALFDKTILFEYLNIDSPKLYTKIFKDGSINLEKIMPVQKSTTQEKEQETANIPIVVLKKLTITDGKIEFIDLKPKKAFTLNLGPYSIKADNISTQKGNINSHTFTAKIEDDGLIHWEGGMELAPLSLHGTIDIENMQLSKIYDYVLPDINAKLQEATLNLKVPYKIDLEDEVQVHINKASLALSNIKILNKKSDKKILDIPKVAFNDFDLEYPKQEVKLKSFNIDKPYVFASLDEDYQLNLVDAFMINSTKLDKQKSQKEEPSKEWSFFVSDAKVNQADIDFEDNSIAKSVKSKLKNTSLHLQNISSDKKQNIDYKLSSILNKDSNIDINGTLMQEPLALRSNIDIKNFHLVDYVNYIEAFVNFDIKKADIDLNANIQAKLTKEIDLKVKADTVVKDLHIDDADNKKLFLFDTLALNNINYEHNPMSLDIKNIKLNKPYIRTYIQKDGSINLSKLIKDSKEKTKQSTEQNSTKEEQTPIKIKIGSIDLVEGSSDFSDFSLASEFHTNIHDLNAYISVLDFNSKTPSELKISTKIGKYAFADIKGNVSVFNIKEKLVLDMLVKNLDLKNLTPYSGEFIGRKIDNGKLSMDLKYDIKKAKLKGDNQLNIDTFELGDEVKSPKAVDLPLGLAVALLKDSDEQINIDLPVSGDMDSPDFSYGGVVWGAITNLMTKIVTSPFNLLGSMLGIDADELKGIDFEKGLYTITSTEHEKLETLQKIMFKRPKIKIEIIGKYDNVYDVLVIKEKKFELLFDTELKKLALSKNIKKVDIQTIALKNIYTKEFSSKKYYELKKNFLLANRGKKAGFDFNAFNKELKQTLVASQKISNQELVGLANKRAQSIKDVLVKEYKIEEIRIHIKEPENADAKRDRWIESDLEISI